MRTRIFGTGSALPKRKVSNDDLSKIMDTSDDWIKSRTGIGARHLAVEESLTELAAKAASQALEEAGILPEELDMILGATLSPDKILPSLSCELQRELGAVTQLRLTLTRLVRDFYSHCRPRMFISGAGNIRKFLLLAEKFCQK